MGFAGDDLTGMAALAELGRAARVSQQSKIARIGMTESDLLDVISTTPKLAAAFAPGIPEKGRMREIPAVRDQRWAFVLHDHHADRAGRHTDLRVSDGTHAYSWATKKPLPGPGTSPILLKRQSDHTPAYMGFSGTIASGYGKGTVRIAEKGTAHVRSSKADEIHFGLTHRQNPESFMLLQRPGSDVDWWLINTTPTRASRPHVPDFKPPFREESPDKVSDYMDPKWVMRAKIDGGHTLLHFKHNRLELFSYRTPASGKGLIDHSYMTDLGAGSKALDGTVFRAETYVEDKDGRHIPNRIVSGRMNSSPDRARKDLAESGQRVRVALLSPHRVKIGPRWVMGDQLPFDEKRRHLERAMKVLDPKVFFVPHEETTPEGKRRMLAAIKAGEHPETDEGVVIEHNHHYEIPKKMVFKKPHEVFVREIHQGAGTHQGAAGAYSYSLSPTGPVAGRVGFSSLSHSERREIWANKDQYVGRRAVLFSRQQHPSGAYRAPQHSHWTL